MKTDTLKGKNMSAAAIASAVLKRLKQIECEIENTMTKVMAVSSRQVTDEQLDQISWEMDAEYRGNPHKLNADIRCGILKRHLARAIGDVQSRLEKCIERAEEAELKANCLKEELDELKKKANK